MPVTPPVYKDLDKLTKAVAKKTKLEPAQVQAVLAESFPSTRAWVMAEIGRQAPDVLDLKKLLTRVNA